MKATLNPYVSFNGNAADALDFWANALGAKAEIMRMGDGPMPVPPEAKNLVMHGAIKGDGWTLMAADSPPGKAAPATGPIAITVGFTSTEDQTRVWERLSEGATIEMALGEQFWGRFGGLQDKFGVRWMLNYEKPRG